MIWYVRNIIEKVRGDIGSEKAALVIIDDFKRKITQSMINLLESNNILLSLLPPNTTDVLHPMDLSVNKPAKDYLTGCFENWYAHEIVKQVQNNEEKEEEEMCLQQVNMSFPVMKELSG